jgi:hypothetical protein
LADAASRLQARLQVVRNMVWIRQVDALGTTYARTMAALGANRFRSVAAAFVDRFPGCFADLEDAGAEFSCFLRQQVDETIAGLAGLARVEWAIGRSFRAADATSAPLVDAASCDVALAPATHLVALAEREVPAVRAAFPVPWARAPFIGGVLVHRTGERVRVVVPTGAESRCLKAAMAAPSFGDLCVAFADDPRELALTLRSLLDREVVFLRRLS